jgi:hypothetical protein
MRSDRFYAWDFMWQGAAAGGLAWGLGEDMKQWTFPAGCLLKNYAGDGAQIAYLSVKNGLRKATASPRSNAEIVFGISLAPKPREKLGYTANTIFVFPFWKGKVQMSEPAWKS